MFRKSTLLALAAVASLGTLALASTDASARGFGGGGFRGGGFHGGGARAIGGSFRSFHGGGFRHAIRFARPHWHHHHRHHWRWWAWRRPYWVAPVIAGGVAATYAAPTYNRCTCLTKEYTQEGAVVFKDVCTQEMAMNPPAAPGPAAYQEPAPQQSSGMPPQTYAAPQGQPYPQYR